MTKLRMPNGADLAGNTFWEFKDTISSNRMRRIVQYSPKTHYADIQISPQWHQWLRHTRAEAPSTSEQQYDLQRQSQLKYLARLADDRWASKPSFLDAPKATSHPGPATLPRDPGGYAGQTEPDEKEGVRNAVGGVGEVGESETSSQEKRNRGKASDSPWQVNRGNPGDGWQPEAWTPGPVKR
ncbi:hypothetical protein MMC24_005028 [Lignoscripta atroalba]|nr:hypothetical protein [Lignoscripta atroalba]